MVDEKLAKLKFVNFFTFLFRSSRRSGWRNLWPSEINWRV